MFSTTRSLRSLSPRRAWCGVPSLVVFSPRVRGVLFFLPCRRWRERSVRDAVHLFFELREDVLANTRHHLGVDRLECLAPRRLLLGRERDELALARFFDLFERVVVFLLR